MQSPCPKAGASNILAAWNPGFIAVPVYVTEIKYLNILLLKLKIIYSDCQAQSRAGKSGCLRGETN